MEMKWYVIKTVSGQEAKVKSYIEQDVSRFENLKNSLGQIVVPMEKTVHVRNGKKVIRDKVYYPGYVMIECDLAGELPFTIKQIPGVISFLSATKGGEPLPMRKSEVSRMFGKMDELSEEENLLSIPFTITETIKVTEGPFAGFNGTVEGINEDKRKLEVMVLIFGRKTPIELSFSQVEKI